MLAMSAEEHVWVERLGEALRARRWRLAVTESCTGGLLGAVLTAQPGASGWFVGGVIAYANHAKEALLGVEPEALRCHGAVSEVVARQMAEGVLDGLGADLALAVTGIAGPGGGRSDKPVGTVWLALTHRAGVTEAHRHRFSGSREAVRRAAVCEALRWLLRFAA